MSRLTFGTAFTRGLFVLALREQWGFSICEAAPCAMCKDLALF